MANKKTLAYDTEYILGAGENDVMDSSTIDSSTIDPSYGPEDNTKVLVALEKKADSTKYAVDFDIYKESSLYKSNKYEKKGAIIRNEDEDVDFLIAVDETVTYFAISGKDDIPENDPIRKKSTSKIDFKNYDGKESTEYLKEYHVPKLANDNCALCFCHKYDNNSGYWLPSTGEYGLMYKYIDDVNEILNTIGGTEISQEEYWTSTQFSLDYAYSFNLENNEYHFWHSKTTLFGVRPIASAEEYIYVEE